MSFAIRKVHVDASYVPEVRQRGMKPNAQRLEAWERKRFEIASLEQFLDQQRKADGEDDRMAQLCELLTPLFLFLAAGWNPTAGSKIGTLHQRAWVLLYAIRPDLIEGETLADAAARYGVATPRLVYLLREFRRYLPDYRRQSLKSHGEDAESVGLEDNFREVD